MRGRIALRKHFVRSSKARNLFRDAFGVCARPRAAFVIGSNTVLRSDGSQITLR
jgi:hypothetical protein